MIECQKNIFKYHDFECKTHRTELHLKTIVNNFAILRLKILFSFNNGENEKIGYGNGTWSGKDLKVIKNRFIWNWVNVIQNKRTFPIIFTGCKKVYQVIGTAFNIHAASKPNPGTVNIWKNVPVCSTSRTCVPLWNMIKCVEKVTTLRPSYFIMFISNTKCCCAICNFESKWGFISLFLKKTILFEEKRYNYFSPYEEILRWH